MEKKTSETLTGRLSKFARRIGEAALHIKPPYAPDFVMDDVHDLTPEMLARVSPTTHVVVFDIEGTLENYKEPETSGGTRSLINKLRDSGYVVAINSNAPTEERAATVHTMFDELVDADLVVTSYDARVAGLKRASKPSPTMLELTEHLIKSNPNYGSWSRHQFLMVGDQLLKDVAAGKRAGTRTLFVNKFGANDHAEVAKWQRPVEREAMKILGFTALSPASASSYQRIALPSELTALGTARQWARTQGNPKLI